MLGEISILGIGLILVAILLGWLIIRVSKSETILNKRLEELEKKAKTAKTIEELENASNELIELSNDCWHELHGTRLTIIKTIIQLKLDNYYTKKTQFDFDL